MKYFISFFISFFAWTINLWGAAPVFANSDLTATVIHPGVTVLETADMTTLYLVEGDSAALLIDTGTKISGLDKIVATLTPKPVTVALTHGHYDHAGNIAPFPKIYMHPADTMLSTPTLKTYGGELTQIFDGDIFDLGNRRLEVVHLPGHTPGSVAFVDFENGMAFTGDAFGSGQLWMQLEPSVPFDVLAESCGRMIELIAERGIDKLYVGHYPYLKKPLGIDYLTDVAIAARMIDGGNIADAVPFGDSDTVSVLRYGDAEIVYRNADAGKMTITPKKLLLKLDDVHYGEGTEPVPPRWNRVVSYLTDNGLHANLGIIGYSLNSDRTDYFDWLMKTAKLDGIEFWNHGYHNRMGMDEVGEFEQDFATQYRALHLTDSLATAKAGLTLRAWGPHWTGCNEHTDSALSTVENIRLIFMHPNRHGIKHFKGVVIPFNLEMEYPFHNPVYRQFLINYLGKWRNLDTFYLQGHPNSWDDARWAEFTQIISRLKADGTNFLTISEYLALP